MTEEFSSRRKKLRPAVLSSRFTASPSSSVCPACLLALFSYALPPVASSFFSAPLDSALDDEAGAFVEEEEPALVVAPPEATGRRVFLLEDSTVNTRAMLRRTALISPSSFLSVPLAAADRSFASSVLSSLSLLVRSASDSLPSSSLLRFFI